VQRASESRDQPSNASQRCSPLEWTWSATCLRFFLTTKPTISFGGFNMLLIDVVDRVVADVQELGEALHQYLAHADSLQRSDATDAKLRHLQICLIEFSAAAQRTARALTAATN
jgi:hypothetical protein